MASMADSSDVTGSIRPGLGLSVAATCLPPLNGGFCGRNSAMIRSYISRSVIHPPASAPGSAQWGFSILRNMSTVSAENNPRNALNA